jgi:hypothetical protein
MAWMISGFIPSRAANPACSFQAPVYIHCFEIIRIGSCSSFGGSAPVRRFR